MSNYLANITARTFNLTPLVRPRLPGQFEPAPVQLEGAINRPEFGRPPAMAAELQEPGVESTTSVETAPRRSSHRKARKAFEVEDEPGYAAPSAREKRRMSRGVRVEALPIEPSINGLTETVGRSGVSQAWRNRAEPHSNDELAPKADPDRGLSLERHGVSAVAEQRTSTIQPILPVDDQELNNPRLPIAPRLPSTTRVEPPLVGVREKQSLDDPARLIDDSPKLPPVTTIAPTSGVFEESGSTNRLPVIVQSRIAPRLEGDRLALNQRANPSPEPTVHVTIGRIEVRAVQSSQPSTAKPRATPPVMNLDDYLQRRNQGSGR